MQAESIKTKSDKTILRWGARVVLMGFTASIAFAAPSAASAGSPPPSGDQLCVVGTVINHEEQPQTDGWTITATPYTGGVLDPTGAMTTTSDATGAFQFNPLTPAQWQIAIDLASQPGEWQPVTPAQFDIVIDYGNASCSRVRFKLRQLIVVNVLKIDDFHTPLPGWTIKAVPGPGNLFALPQEQLTRDPDGIATFKLSPGSWIFHEVAPFGVAYVPVIPLGPLELFVNAPGPYELRFKNRLFYTGCIHVHKSDAPPTGQPYGLPGWNIAVVRADGSVAAQGQTDALGDIAFYNLLPGPYTVVEEQRVGWRPIDPTRVLVDLEGGDICEEIAFTNEQVPPGYVIAGYKIDTNGKVGLPGWTITAVPLRVGDYLPVPVLTNGEGRYEIAFPDNDYRVPGAQYRVCEEIRSGWLPHTPTCQIVTLPTMPGGPAMAKDFENQQVGHQESNPNPGCHGWYKIRRTSTWITAARYHYMSVRALKRANPQLKARNSLKAYAGQMMCIP